MTLVSAPPPEILLLGPVAATSNGAPVALGGRRQRALLALLALDKGAVVSADRLTDELWRGSPPPGATTTLRSYVSRLRTSLGGAAIGARGGGYVLESDSIEMDVARAESLSAEGRTALERGAAGLAAARLGAALALWRGRALDDVRDDGALALEAARLDELRLTVHEHRLEADLLLGRHAEVVPELQALVAAEPLRERLRHHLVLALYRSGRQADALEAVRRARSLLLDELGLEPSAELRELERAVLRHDVPHVAAAAAKHNLPAPVTSFVGRERELDAVAELVHGHRLVTLAGLGGVGKTRLALELARRELLHWRDGVWLVDLTAVRDPTLVWTFAATSLERSDPSVPAREGLTSRLKDAELLLVLDNCEHLVEACRDLARALLPACPDVHVLATSRVLLDLEGEQVFPLDALEVPDEGSAAEHVEHADAVRLFVERAHELRGGAVEGGQQLASAARICRALEGLPLAIELAAARLGVLAVDQLEARLGDRFRLLRSWGRISDPRQHTLEATMDWSYSLLDANEQRLLRRLGVFSGGFTLEAVAGTSCEGDLDTAVELLRGLVAASLVRVTEARGSLRYHLLETVREYALARLLDGGEEESARAAHAAYFLELAESLNLAIEAYESRVPSDHEGARVERENLRAALDWLSGADVEGALRLGVALEHHWVAEDSFEGVRHFERVLPRARDEPPLLLARAHRTYGGMLMVSGRLADSTPEFERSLALYEELGDEWGIVHMRNRLAFEALSREDPTSARELLDVGRAERLGSDLLLGELSTALSWIARFEGDLERASELAARSLAHCRACGFAWFECSALIDLADLSVTLGRPGEGRTFAVDAVRLARHLHDRRHTAFALSELARATRAEDDDEGAGLVWGGIEAEEARAPLGDWPEYREHYADPGEALTRGLEAGRLLPFDVLVEVALGRKAPVREG